MTRTSIVLASVFAANAAAAADDVSQAALRSAAQKGLDLLVRTSPTFVKKGGCNSCHAQMLPAAAQAFARERGIAVGEPVAQLPAEGAEATAERYVQYAVGGGGIASLGCELLGSAIAHQPADAAI